jgi:hypothetical protein
LEARHSVGRAGDFAKSLARMNKWDQLEHKRQCTEFWKRLWNGISGLPLKDGVSVHVENALLDDEKRLDPTKFLK